MNRITMKNDNGYYRLVEEKSNIFGDWENRIKLVQIVGRLEDLLEKYNVESIEELEELINKKD